MPNPIIAPAISRKIVLQGSMPLPPPLGLLPNPRIICSMPG
jgi:hypothetical protein